MDLTKKVFIHLDILGFDEQAKAIEKSYKFHSWKARDNVTDTVSKIIKSHLKENKCKKTATDSWMFLFDDMNSALLYASNIHKLIKQDHRLISLEMGITCGSVDPECDTFWNTDLAMLAINICKDYRNAYKQKHKESIKKSFELIHETAYKEIEKTVKKSLSPNLKYEKINNEVVYSYDPSLYTPPSSISTLELVREEKKVEKHQTITLYDHDMVGTSREKLKEEKEMPKNNKLSKEEELVKLLLSMKSFEIRKLPPLNKVLKETIATLYREDRTADSKRFELVNRILNLIPSEPIVSSKSFDIVFEGVDFSNNKEVEGRIRKFNYCCLLEFSSIEEGYEFFRKDSNWLRDALGRYFSRLKTSIVDLPINRIEATKLYCLGYLAYDQQPELNDARGILKGILEVGMERKMGNYTDLEKLATEKGYNFRQIAGKSGVPHAERLLWGVIPSNYNSFHELMRGVRNDCLELTNEEIKKIQDIGEENTYAYLSTQDIDVYIATSMREPLDFIANWHFVEGLRENKEIKPLNLTIFDPTQAYLPDRIQKGILECLMIDRASITVYNAQELETFGKDAEAGITLAHGKHVIIYVPRLFELGDLTQKEIETMGKEKIDFYEKFKEIYYNLDKLALEERDDFLSALIKQGYLDGNKDEDLFKEAKDKRHAIGRLIKNKFEPLLNQMEINEISSELMHKGYIDGKEMPSKKEELITYCIEKIQNLEVRGLLFRELHPLTFQMSPIDGVVRGSFITRSINETARLLKCFFRGELKYEIIKMKNNYVLVESDSRSPIRAFPENAMIKNAISEVHSLKRAQTHVS